MTIIDKEYEEWFKEPWKKLGLTEEQWTRPLHELTPEHRKIIFDVYNTKYKLTLTPDLFNITGQPSQTK